MKFKDQLGHDWELDINTDSIEKVHAETGVSLYLLMDDKCEPLAELIKNMPVMATAAYILCEAEAAGVAKKDFARGLKGDGFERMVLAFLEELTLFFPDPRRREAVGKIVTGWLALENKALDQLSKEMAKIDPEKVASAVLTKMLSKRSGSSQGLRAAKIRGR